MSQEPLLIIDILKQPARMGELDLNAWDLLVRQARAAGLLARLAALAEEATLLGNLPRQPAAHLISAQRFAERQHQAVHWEIDRLLHVLEPLHIPVLALKGAAYLVQRLPAARGRLFSDIDLLIRRAHLERVEKTLQFHGWGSVKLDAYDQRYYRKWMHELPPLRHGQRLSTIDLHHSILPLTSRAAPDAQQLWQAAVPVPGQNSLWTLGPADMVLHSVAHRFFDDGEFAVGLRDLCDLDDLIRVFGSTPGFWPALLDRARAFGLSRALYYALQNARQLLDTPIPEESATRLQQGAPGRLLKPVMGSLFGHALRPHHASCDAPWSGAARWLLYVRAHYLRMPLRLLVPHLLRKAFQVEGRV